MEIFKVLKHLDNKRLIIYRTVKRFSEPNSIADHTRSGHLPSIRTPALIKQSGRESVGILVEKKILLAKQMNMSKRTMGHTINERP